MDKIDEVLTRRVEKIYPSKKALEKVLRSGKKIRVYLGIDPTAPNLHLGHTLPLRTLQAFANLGHEVIFLFGTGTVLVGDPSERDTGRKLITEKEIQKNIVTWKKQIAPIVNFSKITIKSNADWLTKLTLKDLIWLGSKVSAVQLFKRESFSRRIKKGNTVWFHETFYPLLQGYDSVVMNVDLEIGGSDQMFNMLMGRELQKKINNKEKYVMTMKMLLGTDGKTMSKTSGNTINLLASPQNKYGQAMTIVDKLIPHYYEFVTDTPLDEVKKIAKGLKSGSLDPLKTKKKLAFKIVKGYHGEKDARQAQAEFERVFQKRKLPSKIPVFKTNKTHWGIIDLLEKTKIASSRSNAKRLVNQKAVKLNKLTINNQQSKIIIKNGDVFQVGKRRFLKIKIT